MKQRLFALLATTTFSACSLQPALAPVSAGHPASPEAPEASVMRPSRTLDDQVMSPRDRRGDAEATTTSGHAGMPGMADTQGHAGMAEHAGMKHEEASSDHQAKTLYTCPMHPDVRSDKPGTCPKCGMTLRLKAQTHEQGGMHEH